MKPKINHVMMFFRFIAVFSAMFPAFTDTAFGATAENVIHVIYVRPNTRPRPDEYDITDPKVNENSRAAIKATIANLNRGAAHGNVYRYEEFGTVEQAANFARARLQANEDSYLTGHGVLSATEAGGVGEFTNRISDESPNSIAAEDIPSVFQETFFCGKAEYPVGQKVIDNNFMGRKIAIRDGGKYRDTLTTYKQGDDPGERTVYDYVYEYNPLNLDYNGGIISTWSGDGDGTPAWWENNGGTWVPAHIEWVTVPGYPEPVWVEGGLESVWIEQGHYETIYDTEHEWVFQEWVDESYWDYRWVEGYYTTRWVEGYSYPVWVPGHYA